MIHPIYFIIVLVYMLWVGGLAAKNEIISLLASLFMFALSLYTFVNGIDIFAYNNLLVIMFSAVTFALAAYTSFQASYSLYNT